VLDDRARNGVVRRIHDIGCGTRIARFRPSRSIAAEEARLYVEFTARQTGREEFHLRPRPPVRPVRVDEQNALSHNDERFFDDRSRVAT
jgi:hypothetical protein